MKTSNKSSLITGIVLLAIAAIFSISLMLQPLDFGIGGPGHNNIFYALGHMLFSVYGFSSILIPVFLLVAGLSCFATKWTARKSMRLLTALVPFFTSVITENICRSILKLGADNFAGLKITVAIITGIMLVVIEFLGIGILADKVNTKLYEKHIIKANSNNSDTAADEKKSDDSDLNAFNPIEIKTSSVFDEALARVKLNDASEAGQTTSAENTVRTSVQAAPAQKDEEDSSDKNPASVITQDEYAALTAQNEDESSAEETEEIEWNNVPPAPETLPPEYTEEIVDENDPSLQFPPVDAADDSINPFDAFEEPENDDKSASESSDEVEAEEENPLTFEEPAATDNDEDEIVYDEAGTFETPEFAEEESSEPGEENPYSAANYIDSIMEESSDEQPEQWEQQPASTYKAYKSPEYPSSISLEDDEAPAEDEEKKTPDAHKFPVKIKLDDDLDAEINNFEDINSEENLNLETSAIKTTENTAVEEENSFDFSGADSDTQTQTEDYTIDDTFSDVIPEENNAPEAKAPSAAARMNSYGSAADHLIAATSSGRQHKETGFSSSVSSVFSDMEKDIRESMPKDGEAASELEAAGETDGEEELAANDYMDTYSLVTETEDDLDHNPDIPGVQADGTLEHPTATNLTKDELSDFFDAQQAENTPVGKEIVSTLPATHRAEKKGPYAIPSNLLTAYKDDEYWIIDDATKQASLNLKQTLAEFNIEADIIGIKKGPVVTMFEILPAPGVKLSKIVALQDNIALSLAAQSVRIVAPIPGKQAVGIEVPNRHRSIVGFREIIEMDLDEWKKMAVPVVLGKDILGKAQLIDLVKTPHMLIAGATGSGKSVCVNSLILSILYKRSYKDVKLILVDPKVVELKLYNNIPHLLTPVITEPKKALQALQYCLCEMERRYALLDSMGVRDIANYNQKIKEQKIATEKLPYIVVIIDEFADLMATSGKELESIVARLTAMSRAVGIHLVLATQRPSVNVITGLIKANIPTRIAFMVASRTDSNIIIDSVGAEKLLGRGDMLYASAVDPAPIRIQGTFVSDQEVEDVVRAVKEYGEPDYIDDEIFVDDEEDTGGKDLFGNSMTDDDPLYDQALEIVVQAGKASASYLQRRLSIGYNRAARLVEEMEERGIVGPANGSKPREIIHVP